MSSSVISFGPCRDLCGILNSFYTRPEEFPPNVVCTGRVTNAISSFAITGVRVREGVIYVRGGVDISRRGRALREKPFAAN